MKFFTTQLKTNLNSIGDVNANKIAAKYTNENKVLKRLNSILSRKDIINLDNDKVDALRMLAYHFEDNKGMSGARLVKFLKE